MTTSAERQAAGLDEVSRAMVQVDTVTQRNAASAEELAAMAEELSAQSETLLELVAYFRTDETANTRQLVAAD